MLLAYAVLMRPKKSETAVRGIITLRPILLFTVHLRGNTHYQRGHYTHNSGFKLAII